HFSDGGDNLTVEITRIQMSVTHGGQRLHTEKERIVKGTAPHPGNAIAADGVKRGEEKIERDVNGGNEGGELRPAQAEQPLVGVAPIPLPGVQCQEFELPRAA